MLTVFCDRCEAKIGQAHEHASPPGSKFEVPVFSERDQRLAGAFAAHLCESCARELLEHLTTWWGKIADWQKAWNEPTKAPDA